ncbi:MAG: hypothetical protein ACK53R_09980 [Bacteroidota bacterium]
MKGKSEDLLHTSYISCPPGREVMMTKAVYAFCYQAYVSNYESVCTYISVDVNVVVRINCTTT